MMHTEILEQERLLLAIVPCKSPWFISYENDLLRQPSKPDAIKYGWLGARNKEHPCAYRNMSFACVF